MSKPKKKKRSPDRPWTLDVRPMTEIVMETVDPLWPGRVNRGELTLLTGEPKHGKTAVAHDLVTRVATGRMFPDEPGAERGIDEPRRDPASVVILDFENHPQRSVKPRLLAAGCDERALSRIHFGNELVSHVDETTEKRLVDLQRDCERVREKLALLLPKPSLLVLDPIDNFIGKVNGNDIHDVRQALSPLIALARDCNIALVGIRHFRKEGATRAISLVAGSVAWTACARSNIAVGVRKDCPDARFIVDIGSNFKAKPGLYFEICGRPVPGSDYDYPCIVWHPDVVMDEDANQLFAPPEPERPSRRRAPKLAAAKTEILRMLSDADTHYSADQILERLCDQGHTLATLGRARTELVQEGRIVVEHDTPSQPWIWRLAEPTPPAPVGAEPPPPPP